MANYPIEDYQLSFDKTTPGFAIEDKQTGEKVAFMSFEVTPLKLEVVEGAYVLEPEEDPSGLPASFDPDTTEIQVESAQLDGIGTIHIRDLDRSVQEVHFHLDVCPVTLRYIPGTKNSIEMLSPCGDAECSEVQEGCRTVND